MEKPLVIKKEAKEILNKKLEEKLPSIATNFFAAILVWLFGVLVFIPAAKQILPQRIPLATSVIVLIGFTIFIIRTIDNGLTSLVKSVASVISFKYREWRNSKISVTQLHVAFKHVLYIAVTLLIYLLYSPFLITINPALNGLVLIPLILWIMWTIMKVINIAILQK
jgi:hypothetical protein